MTVFVGSGEFTPYVGDVALARIYVGDVLVWEPVPLDEIHLLTTVGTTNIPIPSWAKFADVVLVGGGRGGNAGNSGANIPGMGGLASAWVTGTWDLRGQSVTSVSVTVGAGGNGGQSGSQAGSAGQATTASNGVHSLTAIGASGTMGSRDAGSPGNVTYGGVTHIGGVGAPGSGAAAGGGSQPGAESTPPGAGGPGGWGGFFGSYQRGGPGARGQAWIKFRSQ
ncbi:hypothetical protein SEA_LASTRESORT_8 [Gordonia phage LastResort]|uniref:minor tail protein n=1 Tax=Gordonia phage JSwag TaxID=1887649 RepID=UPI00084F613C|nr:minor tail protein [Gordonia phage JSwag]AXH47809.1 hypothetical protein SEA_LASTRESORT_8 [Gordonia phage LastResort]QDM56187.1 hypothetical protein SEA_REMO_8 [Gordonia phage ReMo]QLF84884.1 hypothetical protein SEA_EPSOCAMISIO_8 [Gordonia phage Epsocamisio]UVD39757.1 hypothetical protein SEA_ANAYSIA_8 [Gordonia phage Anaysia]WKW87324.1 hypothetical protein SEA_NEBULOSUS_8 [Gordonia phage Nebulosus]